MGLHCFVVLGVLPTYSARNGKRTHQCKSVMSAPFSRIAMDLEGALHKTVAENDVLVIMHYSKFLELSVQPAGSL